MNQEAVRTAIARRYRHFAGVEAKGRSPLYQRWAQSIADDPVVLDFLAQLPGDKRQPNLLLAAARWLQGLAGSYAELREVVVDQRHDHDVAWLRCLIWPGEPDRDQRLTAATTVARADPPRLVRGDLVDELPALAAEAPEDATLVVFHSTVLVYVTPPRRSEKSFDGCSGVSCRTFVPL